MSEFIKNKDKIPNIAKHASPNKRDLSWDQSDELTDIKSISKRILYILIIFNLTQMFVEDDENLIQFTRPKTPYISDEKGTEFPLSLYAMGMSLYTYSFLDASRKKVVEFITSNTHRENTLDEYNLLALRQTTYNHFEQKFQRDWRRTQEIIVKKNMLSRDALATTSNLYRAMPSEQRRKLKTIQNS